MLIVQIEGKSTTIKGMIFKWLWNEQPSIKESAASVNFAEYLPTGRCFFVD